MMSDYTEIVDDLRLLASLLADPKTSRRFEEAADAIERLQVEVETLQMALARRRGSGI